MNLEVVGYTFAAFVVAAVGMAIIGLIMWFLIETNTGQLIVAAIIMYIVGAILFAAITLVTFSMWMWQYSSLCLICSGIGAIYFYKIMELDDAKWKW